MQPLPSTEAEIDAFLSDFESCLLPKERWTHAAHIFSGACYVHRLGEAAACEHMRIAIPRFNESVGGQNTGTSGYHDTVTVFWIKLLAAFHAEVRPPVSRVAFATLAAGRYESRRRVFDEFYSFDIVASTEARKSWIPPDRKPIHAAALPPNL